MSIILKNIKKFNNLGFEDSILKSIRLEISELNFKMTHISSFIGTVIMAGLTIASIFVKSIQNVFPLYFSIFLSFVLLYLIIKKFYTPQRRRFILICNYFFVLVSFVFSIGLDILQKNPTATTICVLLAVMPLLIIDKPIHLILFFLVVDLAFIFESIYIKKSPKASLDVINGISFYVIGMFLGFKFIQIIVGSLINRKTIEIQRDSDSLTKLLNKGAIETRAINFLNQPNVYASMIVIDMDNFKYINDTYGHHAGDEILAKIGNILSSTFRNTDLVSRFGGDEFIIFLPMIQDVNILKTKAELILEKVKEIRIQEDQNYRAHICMGISTFPKDGKDYEELFRNADAAMYFIKKNGKNGFGFYGIKPKTTILIVDDVETNREVLKVTLEKDFNIIEAENGAIAFSLIEQHHDISMVITDIQMPQMDGVELIRKIRANPNFNDISIIANTQYGDLQAEEEVFRLGVDDFVYKPASPTAIQIRVNNLMKIKNKFF